MELLWADGAMSHGMVTCHTDCVNSRLEKLTLCKGNPALAGSCLCVLCAVLEVSQPGTSLLCGKWLLEPLGAGDSQKETGRAQLVPGCPGKSIAAIVPLLKGVF